MEETGVNEGSIEVFREIVERIFSIEEEFLEFEIPTFYVAKTPELKKKYLFLLNDLEAIGYLASMRVIDNRIKIQIFRKPVLKPGDWRIGLALFFATICTIFFAGFLQSMSLAFPYVNAALFTLAIVSILGLHELGHKLVVKRYGAESSGPYFIPGPPPLGTFGAVVIQKSVIKNKDALFDLGASGPIISFIIAVIVTIVGLPLSEVKWVSSLPPETLNIPILFGYLARVLLNAPPNPLNLPNLIIILHPIAFAGYVGIIITMLNLIPSGQLDGGHIAFCFLGPKSRRILGFIVIGLLFLSGYWFFALFGLFNLFQKHPEPLDNVSNVSLSRKIIVLAVIAIFILSITPQQLFR